jgi:hypothetical protein
MNLFTKRFNTLLEAETAEPAPTPEEALQSELDPGTDPAALGAAPISPDVETAKESSLNAQKEELTQWIGRIEEFIDFLNGVNEGSIQTKLHNAGCESMFERIASSETKRVARVAVELSALAESFKGFLIAGND